MIKKYLDILVGALIGLICTGVLWLVVSQSKGKPVELEPAPTQQPLVVYVTGAVPRPGLYSLPQGSRVQDAIDAAGGLLADADEAFLNPAARLEDGQRLDVPATGLLEGETRVDVIPEETLININIATLEELDTLPGIGPTTAQKIIDYREQNGPFLVIDDIMDVAGVGPATFEDIKELITVE